MILFYVSGHGYGHARRSAQIVAELLHREPAIVVMVRTSAPAAIFTAIGLPLDRIQPTNIDAGIVEADAYTIDPAKTVERLESLLARREEILAVEMAAARALCPSLIVTDIPFLAGDVAKALGIPCLATGNFTWDWIYQPMLARHARGRDLLDSVTSSYAAMTAVLRQPFSHEMPQFPKVIDVPIVARKPLFDKAAASQKLGIDGSDPRPRVLIGMRGGLAKPILLAAARACPDFLLTTSLPLPPDAPPNLRRLTADGLDFAELLVAHDAVISKLGYGLVCDAIAAGTRLLWPRRSGFREDELFEHRRPRELPMAEIPREDFLAGRWGPWLGELASMPAPGSKPNLDGAHACADALLHA